MFSVRPLHFLPIVVLAAGCGKGSFNSTNSVASDTLVYPLVAKNTTLDPGKINDYYMAETMQSVVEPLVTYSEDNKIVPWLAESWDITDGGKTYVFHLRKGVKFTNGRPLVADDFRWCWERNLAPSFASPAAGNYMGMIAGEPEYVAGKAKTISGVKVIDDHTLSVTLDKPRPYFLGNLTVPTSSVFAKEAAGEKETTRVEGVVGTGPYKLAKLVPDAELDLDANADYWGGAPKVAHIRKPIITDPAARLSRFLAGDLDYLEIGRQEAQTLDKEKAAKGNLKFVAKPWLQFIVLGQKAYPPFKDARVRRAFAMAINRKKMVADLLTGYDEAKGLVPHGVPGYQDAYAGIPYDPEGAKKLLAEAGYPNGKGLPAVEMDFSTTIAENRVICESVASDISTNLGVKVRPQMLEWGAYLDKQDHGQIPMGVVGWSADYLDPQNFISMQVASFGPQNKEGIHEPTLDDLCAKADVEIDPKVRADLYVQAEKYAIENAVRIPVFMMNQPVLTSGRFKGLRINAIGLMPLTKVEGVK